MPMRWLLAAAIWLAMSLYAHAAPALTNINTATTAGVTSTGLAITAATVSANLIVVVAVEDTGTAAGTVSDSQSNSYTLLTSSHPNGNSTLGTTMFFYSLLTNALSSSDKIRYKTNSGSNNIDGSASYATGCATSNPIDSPVTATATGSGTSVSVTGGTPAQSGELTVTVVGAAAGSNTATITNPSGWAIPPNTANQAGPMIGGGNKVGNASAPAYTSGTLSPSSSWAALIGAFKLPANTGLPFLNLLGVGTS